MEALTPSRPLLPGEALPPEPPAWAAPGPELPPLAPHCPLKSRGSACRRYGRPHTGRTLGSPALPTVQLHSPEAAWRLADYVAEASGLAPSAGLMELCQWGAADTLALIRTLNP